MHRTQLYLDDDSYAALKTAAESDRTSISELVRQAVRDRYVYSHEQRLKDMRAIVGLWKDRTDLGDTEEYIRNLRRSDRRKAMLAE